MTLPRHLVAVWNPSYERDALALHLEVLLARMREAREGRLGEDDAYVWWGKVRSARRQAPLPHLDDLLALDQALEASADPGADEHHLYLTDYRTLAVGHLAEVRPGDDADVRADARHVPPYYAERGYACDCWFKLWDIRRLVADDTAAVQAELRRLTNVRYHDQPVSLYGGMTDLPLLVTRADAARWFEEDARDALTGGQWWAEFDAERAGTGAMEAELRDHRFGSEAWLRLDPLARRFIAAAEQLYRAHWREPGFDLAPVALDLAKAVEVQVNRTVSAAMRGAPDPLRIVRVDGRAVDLGAGAPLTLGAMGPALLHDKARFEHLGRTLTDGRWFVESFAAWIAGELADVRNRAAHPGQLSPDDVSRVRARLMGVGEPSDLLRLARVGVAGPRSPRASS